MQEEVVADLSAFDFGGKEVTSHTSLDEIFTPLPINFEVVKACFNFTGSHVSHGHTMRRALRIHKEDPGESLVRVASGYALQVILGLSYSPPPKCVRPHVCAGRHFREYYHDPLTDAHSKIQHKGWGCAHSPFLVFHAFKCVGV